MAGSIARSSLCWRGMSSCWLMGARGPCCLTVQRHDGSTTWSTGTVTAATMEKAPHQLLQASPLSRDCSAGTGADKGEAGRDSQRPGRATEPASAVNPRPPLPEAPVSITRKATLHGHEVLVTLCGVDFASVKAQVEQASEWLKGQAPAQPPTQGTEHPEGWCSTHGVQMYHNNKDGRSWWSHKTAEGWCKGQ